MSGHSKWANIKNRKSKVDEQRGKIFTKLGREIIVSARQGGGDPDSNPRLKLAIQKARAANMPNDRIQGLIQKAAGEGVSENYEELFYEGYGPGGVALMLSLATDNRNRTASEIRYLFSRHGGSLGEAGCVAWMFERRGLIQVDMGQTPALDSDEAMLKAIEAGAEDVNVDGSFIEVITDPASLDEVRETLVGAGLTVTDAEVAMVSKTPVSITEPFQAQQVLKLVEALEDHEDVQDVYTNFDIPEQIMEEID